MAIEGNLAHVGLADICQLLAMGRKTGCLTVTNRPDLGRIYFKKGRVVYATVANRPDRLGTLLLGNELVTQDQLDAAVQSQTGAPGPRLGEILVEQGALGQEDMEHYVSLQIEEAVYHLFGWTEGTFRFEPDEEPDQREVITVSINTEGLLLEGARRVDEWGLISKKVPSMDLIFSVERVPDEDDEVELTPQQERILPLLDGERTVTDLVDASGLVEFDVAKALFGLVQVGFIQQTGRRAPPEPDPAEAAADAGPGGAYYRTGMLEDAARALEKTLSEDPANADARFRLAAVWLRMGRFDEALASLDALSPGLADRPGVLRNRALALEKLGRFAEAEDLLEQALAHGADGVAATLALAVVALKQGEVEAGRARLSDARTLLGDQPPPPLYYGYAILAAAMAGDLDGAVAVGEEGLERYGSDPVLLVNLGAVQARLGRTEAAERLFRAAIDQPEPLPQAHKSLGDLHYARGDFAGARTLYERALKLDPRLGDDVYMKLGDIARREDDTDWARMLWNRALELNPQNEAVRSSVASLDGG